ncbi:MAG: CinA family protein [Sedimentisphaerales bacterium]|nr:CinA family protein [Sedimentisphaerales bacterium]
MERFSYAVAALMCCLPGAGIPAAMSQSDPGIARDGAGPVSRVTDYIIVVTGSELLWGAYPDSHTYFITRTLHPLGLHCVGSVIVDDKRTDIEDVLRFAAGKAPLVIVTGGLGPTDNDITRETLSDFTGIALKEHLDVLREMARRFKTDPNSLRANLRRQTRTPTQGTYLKNSTGTAVGLVFEKADSVIVALPGPPRELHPMVRDELVPYLSRRFGTRLPGASLTLRFVGLGQSEIDEKLKEHVTLPPDVTTLSQFQGGRVDFTFLLPDDTPQDQARLAELKGQIAKCLGDNLYGEGDTSLEQHVVNLLARQGKRLALVEAGSNGNLAAAMSHADGADRVLAGAYVGPSIDVLRHMLQTPHGDRNLESMASAASRATESQWAIAVGEILRDDKGAGYVQVALRRPDGNTDNRKVPLRGSGELAQESLCTQLLDQLRRALRGVGDGR